MTNFYTDTIMKDKRFNSPGKIGDVGLLEPVTRKVVLDIIIDARQMGVDLEVWETYRSKARQESLFNQGATQIKIVGVHHYGLACDLVRWVDGHPSWKGDWKFLRDLARKYDFISGYDWGNPEVPHTFVDACHIQRIQVADQPKLFSGVWYPSEAYIA